ncbi:FHA domain-containing protein [Spirosoma aerolatum]|uniref:FHA domain-containing protein n=1 Tax=Spirosoma aerolatum TaxID=1211326 RepID=UPI0009ACFF1D|nr:FHA domain-containing protein [Spirosoma aerolatum]
MLTKLIDSFRKREESYHEFIKAAQDATDDALRDFSKESSVPLVGITLYVVSNDEVARQKLAQHLAQPNFVTDWQAAFAQEAAYAAANCLWQAELVVEKPHHLHHLRLFQRHSSTYQFGVWLILRQQAYQAIEPLAAYVYQGETRFALQPTADKLSFQIGRGSNPRLDDGFYRENHIYFIDSERNSGISRNHAVIRYDPQQRRFLLKAENKRLTVRAEGAVQPIQLNYSGATHILAEGDQISLDSTNPQGLLLFSFHPSLTNEFGSDPAV